MRVKIPPPLARQALDSVREVVEFLQSHVASERKAGRKSPRTEAEWLRRARRLRDRLMTCDLKAPVSLDLSDTEAQTLVSCAVFALETSVRPRGAFRSATSQGESAGESCPRRLVALATAVARGPVKLIARPDSTAPLPPEVLRAIAQIEGRGSKGGDGGAGADHLDILHEAELKQRWLEENQEAPRHHLPDKPGKRQTRVPGLETGACIEFEHDDDIPEVSPAVASAGGSGVHRKARRGRTLSIDAKRIREPRLRAVVEADRRGLRAALAARELRTAAMLLSSLLESVLLDVAIFRQEEFGLSGDPESWDLTSVLARLAAQLEESKDRSALSFTLNCRQRLAPAHQLVAPVVIHRGALGRMLQAVQRLVVVVGLAAAPSRV